MWIFTILSGCSGAEQDTAPAALPEAHDDRLLLGDVQDCPAPLPEVRYQEVGGDWELAGHTNPDAQHINGGGLLVEDLDGDTDLEVMVFFEDDPPVLYRGDQGRLIRDPLALPPMLGAPAAADFNGDGHLDVLLGVGAMLISDGQGAFTHGPIALTGAIPSFVDMLPDDIDGDGVLDIFALRNHAEDLSLMQDLVLWGSGADFVADDSLPDSAGGKAFDGRAFDWDRDGDQDFYVVNDMGSLFGANVLWRNDDGVLTDASEDCTCGVAIEGMGVSLGDYNNDTWPDLYLTGAAHNVLLQGLSDGSFVDVTAATSADPMAGGGEMSWGSSWVDYDNDGDQDIVVLQGDLWAPEVAEEQAYEGPIHLMEQQDGAFTDVGPALGLSQTGSHRAVVAADLNGDGVQDLIVSEVVARPRVYLSEGCTEAGWLAVRAPEGSAVAVEVNGMTTTTTISRDPGFATVGPAVAWAGLGEAQVVDRLTVTLPDGEVLEATALPARRVVTVGD